MKEFADVYRFVVRKVYVENKSLDVAELNGLLDLLKPFAEPFGDVLIEGWKRQLDGGGGIGFNNVMWGVFKLEDN